MRGVNAAIAKPSLCSIITATSLSSWMTERC